MDVLFPSDFYTTIDQTVVEYYSRKNIFENTYIIFAASGISVDSMYKSLNRVVLFQLSRKVDSVSGQTQVLDALHKLTGHRGLVFNPANNDPEFLACLCYCLLNLTQDTANRYE